MATVLMLVVAPVVVFPVVYIWYLNFAGMRGAVRATAGRIEARVVEK